MRAHTIAHSSWRLLVTGTADKLLHCNACNNDKHSTPSVANGTISAPKSSPEGEAAKTNGRFVRPILLLLAGKCLPPVRLLLLLSVCLWLLEASGQTHDKLGCRPVADRQLVAAALKLAPVAMHARLPLRANHLEPLAADRPTGVLCLLLSALLPLLLARFLC